MFKKLLTLILATMTLSMLLAGCAKGEELIPNYDEKWKPEIVEIYNKSVAKAEKTGWTTDMLAAGAGIQKGKSVFNLEINDTSGIIYYDRNLGVPQSASIEDNILYRIGKIVNDPYATVGKVIDKNVYIYTQTENGKTYTLNLTVTNNLITKIASYSEDRLMVESAIGYTPSQNELTALDDFYAM